MTEQHGKVRRRKVRGWAILAIALEAARETSAFSPTVGSRGRIGPARPSLLSSSTSSTESARAEDDLRSARARDFQSLLLTRRTINDFSPTLPPNWDDALIRAIAAATSAPNHKRTEPWRFHLLGPESIRQVCELNADIVSERKGAAAGEKKLERWLRMPGWLVVSCTRDGGKGEGSNSMDDDPAGLARENYAAVCCAVQNLCLSLHAEGMGTKWTTGPVNFDERFGAAAGLPEDEFVVGTIWFGEAAKVPSESGRKLSIEDVLTRHD